VFEKVYLEPLGIRHYARISSSTFFLKSIGIVSTLVLGYAVTYLSDGMWFKTKVVYEQPEVHLGYGMTMILEGLAPGEELLWSSFPEVRSTYGSKLASVTAQAQEFDENHDGRPDVIKLSAAARGSPIPIHSAKILLDFSYRLKDSLRMFMSPTVYVEHSSPLAGAAMYTFGELSLRQRDPLTARSIRTVYNDTLLLPPSRRNSSLIPEHRDSLQSIVAASRARNESVVYKDAQTVWLAGPSSEFKVEMTFNIPSSQAVALRRRPFESLKLGWVQYFAVTAAFWFLLRWAEFFLFHYRILPTRVASDITRVKQKL